VSRENYPAVDVNARSMVGVAFLTCTPSRCTFPGNRGKLSGTRFLRQHLCDVSSRFADSESYGDVSLPWGGAGRTAAHVEHVFDAIDLEPCSAASHGAANRISERQDTRVICTGAGRFPGTVRPAEIGRTSPSSVTKALVRSEKRGRR